VLGDYFIAYSAPAADRSPTDDEFNQMLDLTTIYFNLEFEEYFQDDPEVEFLRLETALLDTDYERGFPLERFNIYMEMSTNVIFSEDSNPPPPEEVFRILNSFIDTTYIVDWVWQLTETPFISTQEVISRALDVQSVVEAESNKKNNPRRFTNHLKEAGQALQQAADKESFGLGAGPL
jgi:hypothetical protein